MKKIDYLLKAVLIFIAVLPIIYLNQIYNVPLKAFILGSGSWGFGLVFKMIAHSLIIIPLQNKNVSKLFYSLLNGFLSGFFELIAAYLIIEFMKEKFAFDFYAIISFGLAIGSWEAVIVAFSKGNSLLKGTAVEKHSEKLFEYLRSKQGIKNYIFNLALPIYERLSATLLHISTRGLVFLSIITSEPYPFLIALFVFVIADGLLGFYFYVADKFSASKGILTFFLYLTILTAFSATTFIILFKPYINFTL